KAARSVRSGLKVLDSCMKPATAMRMAFLSAGSGQEDSNDLSPRGMISLEVPGGRTRGGHMGLFSRIREFVVPRSQTGSSPVQPSLPEAIHIVCATTADVPSAGELERLSAGGADVVLRFSPGCTDTGPEMLRLLRDSLPGHRVLRSPDG